MPREPRKAVAIDVVFVLDMASSMQPYLDATLIAITDLAILMYEANGARWESVHIGLWGYRDVQDGSTLEFPLKNFTPPLQVADGFIKTLRTERVPHRTAGADPILSDGT